MQVCAEKKWTQRQLVLSAVTVVYVLSVLSLQYKNVQTTLPFLSRAFGFFGLIQHWGFFAPAPSSAHSIMGIITLDNGAKIMWEPPHPYPQSPGEKAELNRYVKWETEMVVEPNYFPLLNTLCRHVSREFTFAGKPGPRSCSIFKQISETPKYEQRFLPRDEMKRSHCLIPIDYQQFHQQK